MVRGWEWEGWRNINRDRRRSQNDGMRGSRTGKREREGLRGGASVSLVVQAGNGDNVLRDIFGD